MPKLALNLYLAGVMVFLWGIAGSAGVMTGEVVPHPGKAIPPEPRLETTITLCAVGDLLMHMPIVNAAKEGSNYRFEPLFSPVESYINGVDYAVANLETRLAGRSLGFSGYPCFNTPDELADALKNAGFDLVTTANNHSLDRGWEGIVNTIECLERVGLHHIGTNRSPEERRRAFIAEVNGIKIGCLNYTTFTNGLPLPPEHPYAVNILELDAVSQDIAALKAENPDVIIAFLHFGIEYQRTPSRSQRDIAHELCRQGVDVIIGTHPHVVQPVELMQVVEDDRVRNCYIAYSLGNFVSDQRWRYSDSGIILVLQISKDHYRDKVVVSKVNYVPVWVDTFYRGGKKQYRVLPVTQAIAACENGRDPLLTPQDYHRMTQVREELQQLLDRPYLHMLSDPNAVSTGFQS
ncbi:MAG: CapA family protein [Peptococcaceae bacterium]|nr:CapA family protein [Peptococcaceae bacterium]